MLLDSSTGLRGRVHQDGAELWIALQQKVRFRELPAGQDRGRSVERILVLVVVAADRRFVGRPFEFLLDSQLAVAVAEVDRSVVAEKRLKQKQK